MRRSLDETWEAQLLECSAAAAAAAAAAEQQPRRQPMDETKPTEQKLGKKLQVDNKTTPMPTETTRTPPQQPQPRPQPRPKLRQAAAAGAKGKRKRLAAEKPSFLHGCGAHGAEAPPPPKALKRGSCRQLVQI